MYPPPPTSTPFPYTTLFRSSLNLPQRPRNLAPDADETFDALKVRADAPKVPGELAKAGVTFAFESAGLADPKDFVRNAAKADRKSTRLNSSHLGISYAVFCL